MSRPAYTILHRPAPCNASHDWTTVATPHTLGEARDALASPTWSLAHGDLVRVVGAKRDDLYVYDVDTAACVRAPKPFTLAWWEGDGANAVEMLRACERVDRRRRDVVGDVVASVATYAAEVASVRRALAPLVRARIPLSVAVCAALGLRDPLPLRFDVEVTA